MENNPPATAFQKMIYVPSFTAELSALGEEGFINKQVRDVVREIILLRKFSGSPTGEYMITVAFIIPQEI